MKSSKIERLFAFVCALVMAASMFAVGAPALAEETTANDEVPAEAEGAPEAEANEQYTVTFTATVETEAKTETKKADKLPFELSKSEQLELLKALFGTEVEGASVASVDVSNANDIELTGEGTDQKMSVKEIFSKAEEVTFTVKPQTGNEFKKTVNVVCQKSITEDMIVAPTDLVYDGTEKKVTVKDGDKVLVEGTDYSAEYKDNNIDAGKVTCTVTGMGVYTGSATIVFDIIKATHTVTFDANGGSGTMDKQAMESNTDTTLNENKYTRDNYTFKAWNTEADGTGLSFRDKETVRITKDITLYAQWTKKSSSSSSVLAKPVITFDGNPGENPTKGEEVTGEMGPQTVTPNVATKLAENAFKRSHFDFVGWNTAADGSGTVYADMAEITTDTDVTLYAQWKRQVFAITFDANGGSGTMDKQTMECSIATKLNENKYSRDGYTFKAWNTKADGTGLSFKNKETVRITKDITLYAQWTKKGSSSGSSSSKTSGSSSSSSTSSNATLAKTADPTSLIGVVTMASAGVAAVAAGTRKKRG